MIVGARKVAGSMFAFVLLALLLPALLAPLIESLPTWVLWLAIAYVIFLIPFVGVAVFQALVSPALGKRTTNEMGGHLAADVARAMFVMPFKVIGVIFRFFASFWSSK